MCSFNRVYLPTRVNLLGNIFYAYFDLMTLGEQNSQNILLHYLIIIKKILVGIPIAIASDEIIA